MSKLDELMALAGDYASRFLTENCASQLAALESALKAVLEDAERYRWLSKEIDSVTGRVALCEPSDEDGWSPIAGYCTEYIDAARKA